MPGSCDGGAGDDEVGVGEVAEVVRAQMQFDGAGVNEVLDLLD